MINGRFNHSRIKENFSIKILSSYFGLFLAFLERDCRSTTPEFNFRVALCSRKDRSGCHLCSRLEAGMQCIVFGYCDNSVYIGTGGFFALSRVPLLRFEGRFAQDGLRHDCLMRHGTAERRPSF